MIKLQGRQSSYSWRWNMAVKAEVVGSKLEEIQEEHGEITPRLVLDDARSETSELHRLFTWDDAVAGEKYRLNQASYILRNLRIDYVRSDDKDDEPQTRQVRGTVSIPRILMDAENDTDDEEDKHKSRRVYLTTSVAFRSPEKRTYILSQARNELEIWRNRYAALREFDGVIREIDKALKTLTTEIKAAA
jgi:hypothetical protein